MADSHHPDPDEAPPEDTAPDDAVRDDVAIIGLACRFPGADDANAFWDNLRAGRETVYRPGPAELSAHGVPAGLVNDPGYVWASGRLDGVDGFDARFFGYSPREAELMDPQHRLFLETSWTALEDAGYRPRDEDLTVGVYAGCAMNKYLLHNLFGNPRLVGMAGWDAGIPPGSSPDALPARVAYQLGLTGPSVAVLTACSSALTAICVAADAVRGYACDLALAGGVSVELPELPGYRHENGGLLSRTGRCRPYDAAADGSVFGSGVGVVVLKRLTDALADGDHVHAVLRGWAVNNDGHRRAGYTAPGAEGQASVVLEAITAAGLRAPDIQYVEGHGGATPVGDPIEVTALTRAFRAAGAGPSDTFVLGSVKGNIGHVDAAAGAAGLIKTVLAIKHGYLPATLNFTRPNPALGLDDSPFAVVAEGRPWPDVPVRRAGVSSFGMGGANAHVVVEQPPAVAAPEPARPYELILLSAQDRTSLQHRVDDLAAAVRNDPPPLADVAYTLAVGRAPMPHRRAFVCAGAEQMVAALTGGSPEAVFDGTAASDGTAPTVAMLFPGVGDPYAGVTTDLYRCGGVFRDEVDRCAAILLPVLGSDLRDQLFPSAPEPEARTGLRGLRSGNGSTGGGRTVFDQPATFVLEYAVARQLMAWGVTPGAMIGHSIGEYVAATLAGVWRLEDVLTVVARRAQLFGRLPRGGMLAVPLPAEQAQQFLRDGLSIGAVNTPELCVLSGLEEALKAVEAELSDQGVVTRRVRAEHPFHSRFAQDIADELADVVKSAELRPPSVRCVSSVTGDWLSDDEAVDAGYWSEHICRTVRFADAATTLASDPAQWYVEVGTGQTLTSFLVATVSGQPDLRRRTVPALQPYAVESSATRSLLESAGRLWAAGVPIEPAALFAGKRCRVSLPGYRFDRRRYWVDRYRVDRPDRVAPPPAAPPPAAPPPAAPPPAAGPPVVASASSSPEPDEPSSGAPYVAPRTDAERVLATAWADLLGYGRIGIHDDFFQLGGHSLLALQLAGRLWHDHRIELPFSALVEHRTVARLAPILTAPVATARKITTVPAPTLAEDLAAAPSDRRLGLFRAALHRRVGVAAHRTIRDDEPIVGADGMLPVADLMLWLRTELGMPVYPREIDAHPTVDELARHVVGQWERWQSPAAPIATAAVPADRRITDAVGFVLSSPRAGSTLLRVMLAGHDQLFCPPELHLLGAPDMASRRVREDSPDRNQGLERAVMELLNVDAAGAADWAQERECANVATTAVFRELSELARPALLVDKSPGYCRHLDNLAAIEQLCADARYVYLVRHPYAVIDSVVRNRFTALMGAGDLDPYEFGEHVWMRYNANIREFLAEVPAERQHTVRYEDLVRSPWEAMDGVCRVLGVPPTEAVLHPYQGRRMRDGLGDPNLLLHSHIEAELGEAWRGVRMPHRLARPTRELAAELGYEMP